MRYLILPNVNIVIVIVVVVVIVGSTLSLVFKS